MRLWLSLVVFCCVGAMPAQSQTDSIPLVRIDAGTIQGAHFGAAPDEVMFLGIPYAAPLTGERRWKPPQPVEKWQGARKAVSFGPACPQQDNPGLEAAQKEIQTVEPYFSYRTDEDCLYLNLWTTNLPGSHYAARKLPVMFWIHGDSRGGSGQYPILLGHTLARKGCGAG